MARTRTPRTLDPCPVPAPIPHDTSGQRRLNPARNVLAWFFNRKALPIWVILGIFALAFWPTYAYWWQRWTMYQSAFGYGYFIPPTVLWLIWCRRKQIAAAPKQPGHWLILAPILFAVILQCAALIARVSIAQSFAFFVLLMCVPYYVWGGAIYRHIWGALAYAAVMLPWPPQIYGKLLLPAQEISTRIAVKMLELTGLPVRVENGTTVSTGGYSFEVAAACSGLTIVFPVVAIAIMTVMMIRVPWWKIVFMLAISVPLAVFSNAVRIWTIAMIGQHWGAATAKSLHDPSGIAAVIFATILLTVIMALIKAMDYKPEYLPEFAKEGDKDGSAEGRAGGRDEQYPHSSPQISRAQWLRVGLASLLVLPAIGVAFATARGSLSGKVVVHESTLPTIVGDWQSKSEPLTDTELNVLHSPAASQRMYGNPKTGDMVQVLLIQVENTQNAHDPRLCMAGSGYEEVSTTEERADWAAGDPKRDRVSHSVFANGQESLHMYYWMATPRGTIANMSSGLKLEGMLRALKGEPTKGIAVRILGRPNFIDPSKTPSEQVIKTLWKQIKAEVDMPGMLKEQGG